jgi:hypothetical protein
MELDATTGAKGIIRSILKSKKLVQIYPSNNVLYQAAVDEVFGLASDYIKTYGGIVLKIRSAGIFVGAEAIYPVDNAADNFALFLFKEGIRELSFTEGLRKEDVERFLSLLGRDFSKEDSDFLMRLWENDLETIKAVIDDNLVFEYQDPVDEIAATGQGPAGEASQAVSEGPAPGGAYQGEGPESVVTIGAADAQKETAVKEGGDGGGPLGEDMLELAYREGLEKGDIVIRRAESLSDAEMEFVVSEIRREESEELGKLAEILILILLEERDSGVADRMFMAFENVVMYALKGGSIRDLLAILKRLKDVERRAGDDPMFTNQVRRLMLFCISQKALAPLASIIDNSKELREEELSEYAWYFGRDAINPLISLLEGLQTMRGRRMLINVLIYIGKENVDAVIARLSDPLWYVVRNVVCILRGISDNAALEGILGVLRHEHPRVRLEALKALPDFGGVKALQEVRLLFDDGDQLVRITAAAVMGRLGSAGGEAEVIARYALMDKITQGGFGNRELREKRAFYEAMVSVADAQVEEFMLGVLRKKSLFGGRKQAEARACAAYYLGQAGSVAALPELEALTRSLDPMLAEHALIAVRRLRHE